MRTFEESYLKIEVEVQKSDKKDFWEDYVKESYRPVILYGAGGNCEFACFTLSDVAGIKPTCICDTNRTGIYKYMKNCYDIISPQQLMEKYPEAFVLITTWRYEKEIRENLCEIGLSDFQIYFLRYPVMQLSEFREQHLEGYRQAYNFFQDNHSKQKVMDRIRVLLLGEPCPADSLHQDGYFGFSGIELEDNEVFIDGGAYTGDTAEEFINIMDARQKGYRHIYSFEPDTDNILRAEKTLALYNKVELLEYGLWSKKTELQFFSNENGDHIGSALTQKDKSGCAVPVISLDEFFANKSKEEWPTLIKMDIEGAEKEALLGAEKVIKEKKPKLIICAYHKPEDIYELPQTVMKIRSDYKLTLWQIGESFWDIILYAV